MITSDGANYGLEPYGLKTYWKDGEYFEEKIDDSLDFKPLSELQIFTLSTKCFWYQGKRLYKMIHIKKAKW